MSFKAIKIKRIWAANGLSACIHAPEKSIQLVNTVVSLAIAKQPPVSTASSLFQAPSYRYYPCCNLDIPQN